MHFTSSGLDSNSSSKNVVNGPVRVHITRAHTVLPSRLLMRKKTNVAVTCCDNVLDCGHWMILILELSWIIMNYQQYEAQGCHSGLFHKFPQYDSAFIIHILHNSRWTTLAPNEFFESSCIMLHFCKFLSLVRRPCQHLPTSAYSTSLSYPSRCL